MIVKRVDFLKGTLKAMGYQFKAGDAGALHHRYHGQGPETAEAAALLEEMRQLTWLEYVCNEASTIYEAWQLACLHLAEAAGWPFVSLGDGELILKGEPQWVRFLYGRPPMFQLRPLVTQLATSALAVRTPKQLGMAIPSELGSYNPPAAA